MHMWLKVTIFVGRDAWNHFINLCTQPRHTFAKCPVRKMPMWTLSFPMEFCWLWIIWSGVLKQKLPRAPCLLLPWIPMVLVGKIGSCAAGLLSKKYFPTLLGCLVVQRVCNWPFLVCFLQKFAVWSDDAHVYLRRLIIVPHNCYTLSNLLRWTMAITKTLRLMLHMLQKLWSQWKVMFKR